MSRTGKCGRDGEAIAPPHGTIRRREGGQTSSNRASIDSSGRIWRSHSRRRDDLTGTALECKPNGRLGCTYTSARLPAARHYENHQGTQTTPKNQLGECRPRVARHPHLSFCPGVSWGYRCLNSGTCPCCLLQLYRELTPVLKVKFKTPRKEAQVVCSRLICVSGKAAFQLRKLFQIRHALYDLRNSWALRSIQVSTCASIAHANSAYS